MRRLILILGLVDLLLAIVAFMAGGVPALVSSQVGFFSALLVVAASFGSYRRMVRQRLEAGMVAPQTRDSIDRMEDPYGLYDEESGSGEGEETSENFREIVREEKARLKKSRRSPAKVARDAVPAFSPWRLGAYALLVLGFFFLRGKGWLLLAAYLPALALPIVVTVWFLLGREGADA
ncbi:hypothetical protein [Nitratifractor sp.]